MFLSLFLLSSLFLTTSLGFAPDNIVYDVRDVRQFDASVVNGGWPTLVMFKASWCGHCQHAMPEFEAAARMVGGAGVAFARVDCPDHQDICSRYNVTGYPTFKVFDGSDSKPVADYQGQREKQAFAHYAMRFAIDSTVTVDSSQLPAVLADAPKVPTFILASNATQVPRLYRGLAANLAVDGNGRPSSEKAKFVFVHRDAAVDAFLNIKEDNGTVFMFVRSNGEFFRYTNEMRSVYLRSWAADLIRNGGLLKDEETGLLRIETLDDARKWAGSRHGIQLLVNVDKLGSESIASIRSLFPAPPSSVEWRVCRELDVPALTIIKSTRRGVTSFVSEETEVAVLTPVLERVFTGERLKNQGLPAWISSGDRTPAEKEL